MRDTITCAWRELSRRKGRTAVNVLGYALAVGTLVMLLTVLVFSRRAADAILESTGVFFAVYQPADCKVPCYLAGHPVSEAFVGTGGIFTLSQSVKIARMPATPPYQYVKRTAPYALFRFLDPVEHSTITVGGFDPADYEVVGPLAVSPDDVPKSQDQRYLKSGDTGVLLVERTYAEPRGLIPHDTPGPRPKGPHGEPLKDYVTVGGKKFFIVGIVDTTGNTRPARADMYMTLPDLQTLIAARIPEVGENVNMLLVQANSSKVLEQAKEEMKYRSYSGASGSSCHKPAVTVLGMNERSVWLLTLLVSVFTLVSAMKSQLAAVMERRRDIGILKAIGWSNGAVTGQVLVESVLQAAIGGVAGCAAALLIFLLVPVAQLAQMQTNLAITIDATMLVHIVLGIALAVVGGGIAGVVPALIAARERPAVAMRQL